MTKRKKSGPDSSMAEPMELSGLSASPVVHDGTVKAEYLGLSRGPASTAERGEGEPALVAAVARFLSEGRLFGPPQSEAVIRCAEVLVQLARTDTVVPQWLSVLQDSIAVVPLVGLIVIQMRERGVLSVARHVCALAEVDVQGESQPPQEVSREVQGGAVTLPAMPSSASVESELRAEVERLQAEVARLQKRVAGFRARRRR